MKFLLKIFIICLVILAVLAIGKNVIAKVAVENGVRFVTGLKLNMQSLNIGIRSTALGIKELKLFNPEGYPDKVMVDMPEIYVNYELKPFLKGKVHLEEVRVHLKEFIIEKNEKGQLNLDSLKAVQTQKRAAGAAKEGKPKQRAQAKAPEFQIDRMKLRIEKVIYKDYSKGPRPMVNEYNINISESYSNITNPYGIVNLIVVKALMNSNIAALTNFDLGPLQGSVTDALASSTKIAASAVNAAEGTFDNTTTQVKELIGTAPESLKQTAGALGETTEGLTKDLSQTAESLKQKFKLPFGKKE